MPSDTKEEVPVEEYEGEKVEAELSVFDSAFGGGTISPDTEEVPKEESSEDELGNIEPEEIEPEETPSGGEEKAQKEASTESPEKPQEGEEEGGTSDEEGEEEESDEPSEPSEPDEITTLREKNAELVKLVNQLAGQAMRTEDESGGEEEPASKEEPDQPTQPRAERESVAVPSLPPIELSDEDFEKVQTDKEAFQVYVRGEAQRARQEGFAAAIPVISKMVDGRARIHSFFNRPENRDLDEVRDFVLKLCVDIEGENPGQDVVVTAQQAMDRARKVIHASGSKMGGQETETGKHRFLKTSTERGSAKRSPRKTAAQKKKKELPTQVEQDLAVFEDFKKTNRL